MSRSLSITRVQRVQIDAAAEVLRPWGLAYELEMGGKHLLMMVHDPKGGRHKLVIACTPRSEGDAIDFARQKAKRLIRDINMRLGVYEVRRTG